MKQVSDVMQHKDDAALLALLARIESKLDEALSTLDFMRLRMSTYIGEGAALTYLADGSPIYVNSFDFGPPANFINGGVYEQQNLDVLLSFVRDDTVFLDIGANLGFFALQVARRAVNGRVYAFEPHPRLAGLLRASAYIGGLGQLAGEGRLACHECAVGDFNGPATFSYPDRHLGGGTLGQGVGEQVKAQMRRLDDVFSPDFTCDLIKIDVEGHELAAMQGMRKLLERSPDVKILFEKLGRDCGYEDRIEAFLRPLGMSIFGVGDDATLHRLAPGELAAFDGYALAVREPALGATGRRSFVIYPGQLTAPAAREPAAGGRLRLRGGEHALLCHGPYWWLRKGAYRISVEGELRGEVSLSIAARYGEIIETFTIRDDARTATFACPRDLLHFECVLRARAPDADLSLTRLFVERVG